MCLPISSILNATVLANDHIFCHVRPTYVRFFLRFVNHVCTSEIYLAVMLYDFRLTIFYIIIRARPICMYKGGTKGGQHIGGIIGVSIKGAP